MKRKTKFSRLTHLIVLVVLLSTSCAIKISAHRNNTLRTEKSLKQVDLNQKTKKLIITGTIVDQKGTPVPFAAVCFKGTTSGCVAAENGTYSIQIPKEANTILEISSLGYKTQIIKVNGRSKINITLIKDIKQLDEVVATGYQTLSKERATGSFAKLNKDEFNRPSSNISERLVGNLAGVKSSVSSNGDITFQIRGKSSLTANANPLIVVDGFHILGGFNSINPNDIADVTVLKDAAAASIWGAKAANGVIVITTKKNTSDKTHVEFSTFWRFQPKYNLAYMNPTATSAQTVEYEKSQWAMNLAMGNKLVIPFNRLYNTVDRPQSQVTDMLSENNLYKDSHNFNNLELKNSLEKLSKLNNRQQIKNNLLQNPFIKQYNIRISGGSKRNYNSLSMMYENNKGAYLGNYYNRAFITFNNNSKLTKWLKFNFEGSLRWKDNKTNGGIPKGLHPYDMLLDSKGNRTNMNYLYYYKSLLYRMLPTSHFPCSDWSYNPITEIGNHNLDTKTLGIRLQSGLDINIIKGLDISSRISYERVQSDHKSIYEEESFVMRKLRNETSSIEQVTKPNKNQFKYNISPAVPLGGGMSKYHQYIKYYNYRNQINFNKLFKEKHLINVVLGSEISESVTDTETPPDALGYYHKDRITVGRLLKNYNNRANKTWLGANLNQYSSSKIGLNEINSYNYRNQRLVSFYGNASYTFDNKYDISASIRNDAANIISSKDKNRYSPFWSVGVGWNLTNESFIKDINWINNLKLRSTLGESGNYSSSAAFLTLLNINPKMNNIIKDMTAQFAAYGNPNLGWERTKTLNFGLDFSLLNCSLFGSIDIYDKEGYDLIINQSFPSIQGTDHQLLNNGKMYNKGIEISLGTSVPIFKNRIIWHGNINFSYNKNKITKLYRLNYTVRDLKSRNSSSYMSKYPSSELWSFKYGGVKNVGTLNDPNNEPVFLDKKGNIHSITSNALPGDARNYMLASGSRVSPYSVGFQNTFKIYNFNLSMLFTGEFGAKYRRHSFNYPSYYNGLMIPNDLYSEVKNSNPNKIIPIPNIDHKVTSYNSYTTYAGYMKYLISNASIIRFSEINLSYNLPQILIYKLGLTRVQIYSQVNNIGYIAFNKLNEDPFHPKGTPKLQASYTFGLKINF